MNCDVLPNDVAHAWFAERKTAPDNRAESAVQVLSAEVSTRIIERTVKRRQADAQRRIMLRRLERQRADVSQGRT